MRLIVFFSIGAFVAYLIWQPAFPFLQSDSASYMEFAAMRTAGYPLFLALVQGAFGDLRYAIPIQLFAMVASAAYLALEIRRLTRSTAWGVATLVLVVSNIFIYRYAFTIMSEALFFAALAVFAGLICRICAAGSLGTLAAMSCTVGVAILIRPVAYVLLPILIAGAVIASWQLRKPALAGLWAVAPLGVLLISGSVAYYSNHGSFRTQSFLGHNLIGKIAYLPGAGVTSRFPEIPETIDRYMGPLRAIRLDNRHDRFLFREPHYDFVRYHLTAPSVDRLSAQGDLEKDDIRKEVALAFIAAHPLAFAEEVWLQLYSLWAVADLRTASDNARFKRIIASLPVDPFKDTALPRRSPMPWIAVYGIRTFMLGILAATLISIAFGVYSVVRRKPTSPKWMALILLSILLHSYLILVAALQVGIFRYLIVTWPVIIAVGVMCLQVVLDAARRWADAREQCAQLTK